MESKLLGAVGKTAGLGGIALGVVLLIFQDILKKKFLPDAGLESAQAFSVILSLMILTFGIAGIGLIAWLIGRTAGPKAAAPNSALGILAGLIVVVVGAAVYVGSQAASASAKVEAKSGSMATGGSVNNSTINFNPAPAEKK